MILLKVMEEFNCRNLIFSSSASIYDSSSKKLLDESTPLKPANPYGQTKLAIENLLLNLTQKNNNKWRIVSLRYFNPIGAHPSGLIGECPKGIPNNIFPYLCQVASKKIDKLKIFGNDWPTKDGTGIRDFIHIVDLAKAHIKALEYIENSNEGILFLNVGTSSGNTVLDLVKTFEKVNDCTIDYVFVERRKGDRSEIVADNKLIIETFGWVPKFNLEDMCKDGWSWHKKKSKILYSENL